MKIFPSILLMFSALISTAQTLPVVTAHRGGHIDGFIPENSIAGVSSARRFGYGAVECDPKITSDGVIVIMHDNTINRTMRLKDGYRQIPEPVKVSDITFGELRSKYVLASEDTLQRVPLPTLEELCTECKRLGMKVMLHSSLKQAVSVTHRIMGEDWICFSSSKETILFARNEGFKGLCLYSTEDRDVNIIADFLESVGKPCGISSMDVKKAKNPQERQYTPEFINGLTSGGFEVQASIFAVPWEQRAVKEGVTMVLTNICWLQDSERTAAWNWAVPDRKMNAGAVLEHSFAPVPGYGAIMASLDFKGSVKVCMNGHDFEFTHTSPSTETIGLRFYGTVPRIRIEATDRTSFRKSEVKVFLLP